MIVTDMHRGYKQRRTFAWLVMTAYALFCILVLGIIWQFRPYGPVWDYFHQ